MSVTSFEIAARFRLIDEFSPDPDEVGRAADLYRQEPSQPYLIRLQAAVEPQRQELFRRFNMAPGGTGLLVDMRRQLLQTLGLEHPGGDLIVLVVVLVVIFSASRMGRLGNAVGHFVSSFRKASKGEGYVDGKVTAKRISDKTTVEDAEVVESPPSRKP